jgi:transcriptional antiterminator NusG
MRWYVVQAYSGFEQHVKRSLLDRITREGLKDRFGQVLVPTEEVVEMRDGQKRKSDRKFFPVTCWCRWRWITTPGIWSETFPKVGLHRRHQRQAGADLGKGSADHPATGSGRRRRPKPKVLYEPGEMVRVTDGPFNDFEGVVEEVNYEKSRLRVGVMIFGRTTPVELEFSQVEKVSR